MMEHKSLFVVPLIGALASTLISTHVEAAANFTISPTPGKTIPTTITTGQTVSAFYTVRNNTASARIGYDVNGLPGTVMQNTSGVGSCSNPIILAKHGSCILQLDINAPVSSGFSICRKSSCTTATAPLNVVAFNPVPPVPPVPPVTNGVLLSAGGYTNNSASYPLLAASTNQGASWVYKVTSSQPSTSASFSGGDLVTATCIGDTCIGAGRYGNGYVYPFIISSIDGATTWAYTLDNTNVPADYSDGKGFTNVSCSNAANCIAVGYYGTNISKSYGMIATSQDKGLSWNYTLDSSNVPVDYDNSESLNAASCVGSICVTAGEYYDINSNRYGLAATSSDNGGTWNYTITSANPAPGYTAYARFSGVSCTSSSCVIVGQYTAGANEYPMIATSVNGGTSWSYTLDNSSPTPTGYTNNASLTNVSCQGSNCVAGGMYITATDYALIAFSSDAGANWTYTLDNTQLPSDFVKIRNKEVIVSCSGLTCIGVGGYNTTTVVFPFIVTSSDGGATWTYTFDSNSSMPVDYMAAGTFASASCTGKVCIASGAYQNSLAKTIPMTVQSTDGGLTWTYAVTSASPALPSNFNGGSFNSSASSTKSYLPESLRFMQK